VKQYFFTGVDPPNLLSDYDVLGFDADHCIVKYNVRELMELVVKAHALDMHKNDGYPVELTHITDAQIDICLNNAVWDIEKGNMLKLAEGKEVIRAWNGFEELPKERI